MQSFIRSFLIILMLAVQTAGFGCGSKPQNASENTSAASTPQAETSNQSETLPPLPSVQQYSYQIVNTYPHDTGAFTEGLVLDGGVLYESTGLKGQSSLRKVDLETGKVLQIRPLGADYFGEGITMFGNTIIQLTWQDHKGFVYDKSTFELRREFNIDTEGWGITTNGKHLIMSDGTSTLHILDPETFENIGDISVQDNGGPVNNLNELEYVGGLIYANVWNSDNIAIIDPGSGRVNGWVNLKGLLPAQSDGKPVDVLNGIAYDAQKGRLFVTGKYWPSLFEIKLVRQQ
ncbi:MAG: glutaminyl-peptide cyclotransferase [Dehalococcoidales bacterium]|nr:glutaminyl-peptide cyclotransferase [Dehalococcoidales bacterium]